MEEICDLYQGEENRDVDLNRSWGLHLTVKPPQNDELNVIVAEDERETGDWWSYICRPPLITMVWIIMRV